MINFHIPSGTAFLRRSISFCLAMKSFLSCLLSEDSSPSLSESSSTWLDSALSRISCSSREDRILSKRT